MKVNLDILLLNISLGVSAHTYKTEGTIINNILLYKEQDETNVEIKIEDTKLTMKRHNQDMELLIVFEEDVEFKGIYKIHNFGLEIPVTVLTDELKISNDEIFIKYYIALDQEDNGLFEFSVVMEENNYVA